MSENAGGIYYDIEMDVRGLLTAQQRVNQRLDLMERGFDSTTRSINNTERSMSSLSGVAVALATALSVKQVSEYADAWATVNNKLANSLRPNEQLAEVTERVFNITQQTRGSLDATASLYARLERATRQYGTSAGDLSKLTTIINQGFVVSGATAQEAENAIIQLSQGLASGALRGEEFNSVNEQGNRLIVALADSMGVSIGQMRNMAAQGKLTTDVVVNGLLSQGAVIGAEFANTTTTISQALQVAGNNITKFFGENSTVRTAAGVFNNAVVTASENIDVLSAALTAVVTVMGSRYVGALTMAAAGKVKLAIATREEIVAENQAAQAAANKTTADLRAASIAKERAIDEVRLAQMMKNSAIDATSLAAAEARLSTARLEAVATTDNYNRALAANTIAQNAASAASARATISIGGLASRALGLIGGPVGAAMLAAGAIFYFSQKAKEARDDANNLADSVNGLVAKFKDMSNTELASTIGKLGENLPELSDASAEARLEFDKATAALNFQKKELENWGTGTKRGRQAAEALGGAQDRLAIAAYNLERAENRYSQTLSAINIGRSTLNGTMRQGIDLLRRDGEEAGVAAGKMNQLGKAINFVAVAKEKFNATSLIVTRPKDIQDYLDGQQDQIELQSELNDRKREQLKAEMDIRSLAKKGGDSDTDQVERDVKLARERAGVSYDQKKADEDRRKEQQKGEQQDKKSASSAESVAQKLASLKQQSDLAAGSTQELSREQAILRAEQSLGKGATASQIQQAHDYAAAIWDTAAAIKARNAVPELKENADYTAQKSQLEMLKSATDANGKLLISQEQYSTASEQLELEHQVRLSKIRAQQVSASPIAEARGEIDPVTALANQNAQKLALMKQYYQQEQAALTAARQQNAITETQYQQQKLATDGQYQALINAQNAQYEQQRTDSLWAILSQQSLGYDMLTGAVDAFAGNASNAMTGLITGSMSASEALRSLGSTMLNSVVNSLVQVGVEALKNYVIGQTIGTASVAAGVGQATALSAAWATPAALASLASFGANAAPAQAGMTATVGLGNTLALAGARKNGGPVSAGSVYQVGEGGRPEIYRASTGKQYMIPGDNGSVLSNKDISGKGGVTVINQIENYSSGAMVDTQASSDSNGNITIQTIITDIANGGQIGQAIANYHNAPRRARG